jgi:hypothetical protein
VDGAQSVDIFSNAWSGKLVARLSAPARALPSP